MAYSFRGGIHPGTHADPGYKSATNTKPIEKLALPDEVILPVSMHIGAPAKPIVSVGDTVDLGQPIAEAGGFVSAPVHATVSGKVKAIEPRLHPNGSKVLSIVIENDGEDRKHESVHPYDFASMRSVSSASVLPVLSAMAVQPSRPMSRSSPVSASATRSSSTLQSVSRTSRPTIACCSSVRKRPSAA